jgi:hypothetical protein
MSWHIDKTHVIDETSAICNIETIPEVSVNAAIDRLNAEGSDSGPDFYIVNSASKRRRFLIYRNRERISTNAVMGGCFCPPHFGHMLNAKGMAHGSEDNKYIFVWDESEGRHKFPHNLSLLLWSYYLEKAEITNISVESVTGDPTIMGPLDIVRASPGKCVFINIIVGSDYSDERIRTIKRFLSENCSGSAIFSIKKIERIGFSATEFVECIKTDPSKCGYFLPTELSPVEQNLVIQLIRSNIM